MVDINMEGQKNDPLCLSGPSIDDDSTAFSAGKAAKSLCQLESGGEDAGKSARMKHLEHVNMGTALMNLQLQSVGLWT